MNTTASSPIMLTPSFLSSAPTDSSLLTSQYVEILEKTNQQLGLWSNPYGVAVGILAVFIGVIAIAVTIALYKQSADYQKKLEQERTERDQSFQKIQKEWADFIRDRNTKVKKMEDELDTLITEYKKQLETASEDTRVKIEQTIQQLKQERARLESSVGTVSAISLHNEHGVGNVNGLFSSLLSIDRYHRCTKCGYGFNFSNPEGFPHFVSSAETLMNLSSTSKKGVRCPSCGNIDEV